MCIIAAKYAGEELPKDEHLREAEIRNKDGIGVAYWKAGSTEVVIKKDFESTVDLIPWLKENIKAEDACIIHFRFATHGLVDKGNRHPFPITKNKELLRQTALVCQSAVAHNGVIEGYAHKKFSDTQKFVLDILADDCVKNNLAQEKIRKLLTVFLAGDRLSILMNDGTIYLLGEWVKEGNIFYSNKGYEAPKYLTGLLGNCGSYYQNKVQSLYQGHLNSCDGCGQTKKVMYVDVKVDKQEIELLLCKACRKKLKKGKLEIAELEAMAEVVNDAPQDEETKQLLCHSCDQLFDPEYIVDYYHYNICKECLKKIPNIDLPKGP